MQIYLPASSDTAIEETDSPMPQLTLLSLTITCPWGLLCLLDLCGVIERWSVNKDSSRPSGASVFISVTPAN